MVKKFVSHRPHSGHKEIHYTVMNWYRAPITHFQMHSNHHHKANWQRRKKKLDLCDGLLAFLSFLFNLRFAGIPVNWKVEYMWGHYYYSTFYRVGWGWKAILIRNVCYSTLQAIAMSAAVAVRWTSDNKLVHWNFYIWFALTVRRYATQINKTHTVNILGNWRFYQSK